MKKLTVFLPLIVLFILVYSPSTLLAQVLKSDNYEIQLPNFNSGAGIPSSSTHKIDSTIGQTAPGLFSSAGYRVMSGFQYIHSIIPFSFSISSIAISFAPLMPDTPQTISQILTVSAGGAGGYQVTARENNPLKFANGSVTIPDTTCDSGCDEETAGAWTEDTKYGFGFNMTGYDIPGDFTNDTFYRQFADTSNAETPKVIMSSTRVYRSRQSTVTFKVNISDIQQAGKYQNIIYYTAIPSY